MANAQDGEHLDTMDTLFASSTDPVEDATEAALKEHCHAENIIFDQYGL